MGLLGDVFNAVGSIIGGSKKKKASRKAQEAQVAAINSAMDESRRQFDLSRADINEQYGLTQDDINRQFEETQASLTPWLTAGQDALGGQMDLLGLGEGGSSAQADAIAALRGSPLFQSLYDTGEEAILANAAATGGLRGGNTQRSLADFGRDTLAGVIENYFSKLGGISGQGLQTGTAIGQFGANRANTLGQLGANRASTIGALGADTSNIIAQLLVGQGNAQAGGLLTRGNITANQWGTAADAAGQVLGGIFPGGIGGLKF